MRRILATTLAFVLSLLARSASAEELPLRVVSYNVFAVPGVASDIDERLAMIGARIGELAPDVVILQELWYPEAEAIVAPLLRAAGLVHQRHDPEGGSWIGSRFPWTHTGFRPFDAGQRPWLPWHLDWIAEKGVAQVSLETPAGALGVANVHLQSSYAVGDYRLIRLSQAAQVADWLGACGAHTCDAVAPLIVGADLNASPDTLEVRLLTGRTGARPASEAFDIDHQLYRSGSGMAVRVRGARWLFEEPVAMPSGERLPLSDHPCLLVDYLLEPCADCPTAVDATRASELQAELDGWLSLQRSVVERAKQFGRAGAAIAVLAAWLFLRSQGRPRWPRRLAALAMLLAAIWLAYLGVLYGPYESRLLDALVTPRRGSP